MGPLLIAFIVVGGFVLLMIFWIIGLYNGLQRKKLGAESAWSDIDVQLKRRHDLIPNLVSTVQGYATHEKSTFDAVTQARAAAAGANGIAEQAGAENMLTQTLGKLFAVAEAYPDLKANTNFMQLQEELTSTENKIGFSRQHFNTQVRTFNEAIKVFPSNLVAGVFNFSTMDFFELDEAEAAAARVAPKVQF